MLFEKHAFVGHVLVHDPEPFGVHCNDEARAYLTKRFEVGDLFGAWKACGSVRVRRGKIGSPISVRRKLRRSDGCAKCSSRSEWNPLLDRPHRRACEIESPSWNEVRADAGAHADLFHRRKDRARDSRFHGRGRNST